MATDWHFGYLFDTEIVGESNYQQALKKCYTDKDSYKKGKSAFVNISLIFETNNKYDKNAVAVISPFGLIGYLSREDAIRYRHLCEGEQLTFTTRCKVFKGKKGIYGAWVDLDLSELPKTVGSLKKYNNPHQDIDADIDADATSFSKSSKPKKELLGLWAIIGILMFPYFLGWIVLHPKYSNWVRVPVLIYTVPLTLIMLYALLINH